MWVQDESGRVQHPFEPVMLGATLALVPILVIENGSSKSSDWHTFAVFGNWVIWAIFALELSLILYAAPRKRAALRAHWLDAALVALSVPFFGPSVVVAADDPAPQAASVVSSRCHPLAHSVRSGGSRHATPFGSWVSSTVLSW